MLGSAAAQKSGHGEGKLRPEEVDGAAFAGESRSELLERAVRFGRGFRQNLFTHTSSYDESARSSANGSRFALDRPGPDLYVYSPRPQDSNELLIEIVAGIIFCGMAVLIRIASRMSKRRTRDRSQWPVCPLENSWHFLGRTISDS